MDIAYAPKPDGQPDPGEIVWAWVPHEEDDTLGTDRLIRIDSETIRREGAVLDEATFNHVADEARRHSV